MPQFCKAVDATVFLRKHPDPQLLPTTAEKLRWYRYKNNLLQSEIAFKAGVDRKTYTHYENTLCRQSPPDKLQRIATLFGVEVAELI